nr:coiled-coil domain-containing protein 18-like [Nerophis lumbriciformis]
MLENSNQGRDQISINNKLIVGGKIQLDTLLSNIVKETAETKHLKTKLLVEKQNLDKLKNNIKQERAYLSKANMLMSKEKLELVLMKSDMQKQMIALKENQRMTKERYSDLKIRENEFRKNKTGLDRIAEKMKKEREQIHQLIMDVVTKRDEDNDNRFAMEQQNRDLSVLRQEHCEKSKEIAFARTKICTDMEKLLKMKADFETEKILHAKDTETMEQLQSEQKVLQDHFRSCILSMRRVTDDLKAKYKNKLENIDKKVVKLEAKNEGMPKLVLTIKHMLENSNQGRDQISINNKLIVGGKIQLDTLLSNIVKETAETKHLKTKLLVEKQNLDKLKNNIKQERAYLSKANMLMSKEKLELALMKSDMQKQLITLEENQHMIKEGNIDLEIREKELKKKTMGLDTIAEKMKKGREQIHQLNMDVGTKRDEVNDNRCAMEQQNKDLSVLRQEHCQKSKEIAFARTKISTKMEKLLKMKATFETEKILHAKDTETMEQLQSEQKVLQDHFRSCILSMRRVTVDLKAKYEKKLEDIDKKVVKLEAKNEGMPKLLLKFKQMLEDSNQGRNQISINNKLIGGKIQLDNLLSNVVKESEEIKHLKTKLLVEKQNLDKLKNNIKQEKEILIKANELMSKEKLELVLMKSDMQKQMIALKENQRMTKERYSDLKIRENEFRKNKTGLDRIAEKMKKEREQIHQLIMDVVTKRDEDNDNRFAMEQQNRDLSVLRQEHCEKSKEIAFARTKIRTDMEKLLKMKADFETEKILHAKDTETMQQLQSKQKVLQDYFKSCILSIERVRYDLKAKYKKKLEDIDKNVVKLAAKIEGMPKLLLTIKHMLENSNQGRDQISINNKLIVGGKIQLDALLSNIVKETAETKHLKTKLLVEKQNLDKLKKNIKQERAYLSKANMLMSKEKLELALMKSDMQKQLITLEENQHMIIERNIDLEIRENELKKKTMGLDTIAEKMKKGREQIHQLNMDVGTKRDEVNDNRCAMEQQNKDLSVFRQEHCQKSKEIAFARTKISTGMEKLLKMKADFETEKILHAKYTETMEQLQSEQKVLQDHFRSCILSMRRVTDDLKAKYEKKLEDIDKKVVKLEAKNEGMPKLLLTIKHMLENSNQGRDQISINNKLIVGGKIQLDNLLSNVLKESEEIKHLKNKLLEEKQNLDKLKNNIKQEEEILSKANEFMSKEKLELVLIRSDMQKQMIALKEKQRMTKERYSDLKIRENEFRKNKTGLDRIAEKMKKEREQIHQLIMDVVTKRDEVNDNRFAMEQQNRDLSVLRQEHCQKSKEIAFARTNISTEMEKLLKMKADFETEKILQAKDTETMEQRQSEQKVLQDHFRSCILSMRRVTDDLKAKYEKKLEDIDKKVVKLEAKNEGMPKLLLTIKHMLENSNQGSDQISINNKLIVGGKIQLDTLLSNIVKETAETKHLQTKLLVEKQNLEKLKNNIKQERAYLSKANMLMSKEKLELALMKSDMQKQLITLEENQHMIKEGNIDLEIRENELKKKTMGLDTIAEKMKKGREQIHQLNMDVGTKRDEVNDNRCAMEQQNKDLSVFRQEHCQKSKEIAFARTKISTGMEKLLKMKATFETEKILHAKDTETMEQLQSEQKVLQDHFRSCILSMRRVTDDLKAKYEKKLEDIDKRVVKLEAKNEGMPKLLLTIKHMLENSNQGSDQISINNKLIVGGKIQLDTLLSNIVKETAETKHLKTKLLVEKQNLEKLKNNIKQERAYLSKANMLMSKEKLELALMKSDMQKQLITLEENQHMIIEGNIDLEIRENELKKKTMGLDTIAEKMKKGREQIHQLNMDVGTKRDEVNDNRCAMEQQNKDLSVFRQEHCQKSKEIAFARTKISTGMEKLLKMKADFETEKILHAKDTETMEQRQSEQKVLQDHFRSCILSMRRVTDDLKAKYKKKLEDIDKKVVKLEAKNESMPKLLLTIKHMLENSNQGRDQISINNKLIVGGKIQLDTLLSNIVKETAETKHLKTKLLVEKQNLEKLKNNIKQERAYLGKANMLMSKEKLELALMKSDMQKQLITLEENQHMIKEGNIDLEIRENELKKKTMGLDTIAEKMKKGREQIHQLNMDTGTLSKEQRDCICQDQNKYRDGKATQNEGYF